MNHSLATMTGLMLLDPWMLVFVGLLPLALLLRRVKGAPVVSFAPSPFLVGGTGAEAPAGGSPLPLSWRVRLLWLPAALQLLALGLVAVALARPVARRELPLVAKGIDIFLCLDVSSSMAHKDMDPQRTRLDIAKEAAARFVAGRPEDRVGLIRFARYPDVLCPLTLDHEALTEFIAGLERVEADGPEDMTGIGTAVARAAEVIDSSESKSKVVILLTDGEENVARADTPDEIGPARAAALCEQLGVRVYTIAAGIGKRNRDGRWVPIDTSGVRRLAERTGGAFYEARDAGAVANVYRKINGLEKVEFEKPRYELEDRFLPFVFAAFALLLVARLLGSTVFEVLP